MAYAWWCRVSMICLSIGPSWAWRRLQYRWPGQESSLLFMGEVRPPQPRSFNHNISRRPLQRWLHRSHLRPRQFWRSLRMKKAPRTQTMQQIYRRHRVLGIPGLQLHRRHLSQLRILLLHLMASKHHHRRSNDMIFIYFSFFRYNLCSIYVSVI